MKTLILGGFLGVSGIRKLLNLNMPRAEWRITSTITICLIIGAAIYILVTGGNKTAKQN